MNRIVCGIMVFSLFSLSLGGATFAEPKREGAGGVEGVGGSEKTTVSDGPLKANELVRQGMRVEFLVEPLAGSTQVREGEYANVSFRITDAARGTPVTAMTPSVWMDLEKEFKSEKKTQSLSCRDKINIYLQGTIGYRPDIDLNSYFILVLNNDASISVIDPIMGMTGITKLFAMVILNAPGEDWALSGNEKKLFVTMPRAAQVAVVDTDSFKVDTNLDAGVNPVRIALQPDGKYAWVGNDSPKKGESGVTVIDATELKGVARIPTGTGHHEIAFSDDSRYAFVTNRDEGTLSVIDIQQLKKIQDIKTGTLPVAVAFSSLSKEVYVANEGDGTLVAVDGRRLEIARRITLRPGLTAFRFAPGGRWGFAANGRDNLVHVVDASNDGVAYTVEAGVEPDQFAFSDNFAYIRSRGSAELSLIQLSTLGKEQSLAVVKVQGGQTPPRESKAHAVADAMFPTSESGKVLISNPADKLIYYYMEGMAVPMGSFNSFGRVPKGVRVAERRLRETAAGVYSAKVRIPKSGRYNVAFLLNSPQIVHCFEFAADPNPLLAKKSAGIPVGMEFLTKERSIKASENFRFQFRLTNRSSDEPLVDLGDVRVIVGQTSGSWQERYVARAVGNGVYEVSLKVPKPGIYQLFFAIPSKNVTYSELPYLFLTASDDKPVR